MSKVIVTDTYLSNIASAIRGKAGTQSLYTPAQMASAITALPSPSGTTNITSNGIFDVSAFASASVSVPVGVFPTGTKNITSNGVYDVASFASASVAVPTPAPSISALTVTENGTYSVPSGVDGYNPVTVNVSGGGGGGNEDALIERTISGTYTNSTATSVGAYAFYSCLSLNSINLQNAAHIGSSAFTGCANLTDINLPNALSLSSRAFYMCSKLTNISLPKLASLGTSVFESCASLSVVNLPALRNIGSSAFSNCLNLAMASFPSLSSIFGNNAFYSCAHLLSLYLLGSSVAALANKNAFSNTPISNSTASTGGVYGSIYVKASLYSSWIAKLNWSIYSARFVSLTDEEIEALG